MAAVPDNVLQWLHGVLRNEYHDVERMYNDAATVLATFPSLSPRTEVYTFENGSSALLLLVAGTIPVDFRGQTYRFPLAIWTPHRYPYDGPIVFVRPAAGMVIRAGQHVGPDGRIYHPYLAQWTRHWDKSSLRDFLVILQDVFAKDPPVMSQQQAQQAQQSRPVSASPMAPPRPPSLHQNALANAQSPSANAPPRLPPKGDSSIQPAGRYDRPAPLPQTSQSISQQGRSSFQPVPTWQHVSPGARNYQSPPLADRNGAPSAQHYGSEAQHQASWQGPQVQSHAYELPLRTQPSGQRPPVAHAAQTAVPPAAHHTQYVQGQPPSMLPAQQYPTQQHHQAKQMPIDLLTSPLDVTLPSQTGNLEPLSAPPIPPNPEKDALLHALSQTLGAQTQRTLDANKSAVPPLLAQHHALTQAQATLAHELTQLHQLDALLATNEHALTHALHAAAAVIRAAALPTQRPPHVDELLVCASLVGSQVYALVAELRGCEDARRLLVRGLDRGRVGAHVFVKTVRGLAREEFLKKALLRKAARGMGLDEKRWQAR